MSSDQLKIDTHAQKVLDMFDGENSSICLLSILSVIEHLADSDKATAAFRKQTADLLEDQVFRIKAQMRAQGLS